jgi:predicted DNA-binding transcriptional regulator YafY
MEFRTFGIDRIHNLKLTSNQFKKIKKKENEPAFDEIMGINYSEGALEEVILSFTSFQAKYIKSQPLHSSQEVIKEDEDSCDIRLLVRPNYELTQTILMYGDQVEVIQPSSLRSEIKDMINNMADLY